MGAKERRLDNITSLLLAQAGGRGHVAVFASLGRPAIFRQGHVESDAPLLPHSRASGIGLMA